MHDQWQKSQRILKKIRGYNIGLLENIVPSRILYCMSINILHGIIFINIRAIILLLYSKTVKMLTLSILYTNDVAFTEQYCTLTFGYVLREILRCYTINVLFANISSNKSPESIKNIYRNNFQVTLLKLFLFILCLFN